MSISFALHKLLRRGRETANVHNSTRENIFLYLFIMTCSISIASHHEAEIGNENMITEGRLCFLICTGGDRYREEHLREDDAKDNLASPECDCY